MSSKLRVCILGFGAIGQYIAQRLLDPSHPDSLKDLVELVCIWNRTPAKLYDSAATAGFAVPHEIILQHLDDLFPTSTGSGSPFAECPIDLLIEVCHPSIYVERGAQLLRRASLYVGSPTAFANGDVFDTLYQLATAGGGGAGGAGAGRKLNGLYLPCGALWGASDILKMGRRPGAIASASITMTIPPHSLKLNGEIGERLEAYQQEISAFQQATTLSSSPSETVSTEVTSPSSSPSAPPLQVVLYDGPVRHLCPMAPNNVNTMACFAMATGPSMGFDRVHGRLITDRTISAHIIDVVVRGPTQHKTRVNPVTGEVEAYEDTFEIASRRYNPCNPNAVTASATYPSFYASLRKIAEDCFVEGIGLKGGVHFV